jgi:GTPase involved in cell partitioning and DNA repair
MEKLFENVGENQFVLIEDDIKKLQKIVENTMQYHNKFISENPSLITESSKVENNDIIKKLQKIVENTMQYHNKFISENEKLQENETLNEFYKNTLKLIFEIIPNTIISTQTLYDLYNKNPNEQKSKTDFIKNVTYINTLILGVEPVIELCNKKIGEFKKKQNEFLDLRRKLYKPE